MALPIIKQLFGFGQKQHKTISTLTSDSDYHKFDTPSNVTANDVRQSSNYKELTDVKGLQHLYNGWFSLSIREVDMINKEVIEMFRTKSTRKTIKAFNVDALHKYFNDTSHGLIEIELLDTKVHATARIHLNVDFDSLSREEYLWVLDKLKSKNKQ